MQARTNHELLALVSVEELGRQQQLDQRVLEATDEEGTAPACGKPCNHHVHVWIKGLNPLAGARAHACMHERPYYIWSAQHQHAHGRRPDPLLPTYRVMDAKTLMYGWMASRDGSACRIWAVRRILLRQCGRLLSPCAARGSHAPLPNVRFAWQTHMGGQLDGLLIDILPACSDHAPGKEHLKQRVAVL